MAGTMAQVFNPFDETDYKEIQDCLTAIPALKDYLLRCQDCDFKTGDTVNKLNRLESFFKNVLLHFFNKDGTPIRERNTVDIRA